MTKIVDLTAPNPEVAGGADDLVLWVSALKDQVRDARNEAEIRGQVAAQPVPATPEPAPAAEPASWPPVSEFPPPQRQPRPRRSRRRLAGLVALILFAGVVVGLVAALTAGGHAQRAPIATAPRVTVPAATPPAPSAPPNSAPPNSPTVPAPVSTPSPAAPPAATSPGPTTPTNSAASSTTTVQAGQNFWSIAQSVVQERQGATPTAAQVGPYWVALVEANRHHLPVPGDPNLIYTGTRVVLPPG